MAQYYTENDELDRCGGTAPGISYLLSHRGSERPGLRWK